MTTHQFKIILVGDGGVGKTALMCRHLTGNYSSSIPSTQGVAVHPLNFNTNRGMVQLSCWDTAGRKELMGLADGYYLKADAVIYMFDLSDLSTFENIPKWCKSVTEVTFGIPAVLVGNKADLTDRQVTSERFASRPYYRRKYNDKELMQCYEVSAKSCYNFDKPFLYLIRELLNDQSVNFVGIPVTDQKE